MRIGALVQARMSSARLPGKVLLPLAGRPALAWLVERLEHAEGLDAIAIATSTEASDDPVAAWCAASGVPCHRGPLDDVARRMLDAARAERLDAFVRVNGDSPLLDQRLVGRGVALMRDSGADLVTNVAERTFPHGQSVEVVRTDTFARLVAGDLDADEREHVTLALYRRAAGLAIVSFTSGESAGDRRQVLDTPADAARLEALFAGLERPHWELQWTDVPA